MPLVQIITLDRGDVWSRLRSALPGVVRAIVSSSVPYRELTPEQESALLDAVASKLADAVVKED